MCRDHITEFFLPQFINTVAGQQVAPTGTGPNSRTEEVRAYKCKHPVDDRYVILVDTPGLDDIDQTDFTVLDAVRKWLDDT
jgi:GTPase Era involved in 16S rRNA processing